MSGFLVDLGMFVTVLVAVAVGFHLGNKFKASVNSRKRALRVPIN